MKKSIYLLFLCFILSGSIAAQTTTTSEDVATKNVKPKKEGIAKKVLKDLGLFAKKTAAEHLQPVVDKQLNKVDEALDDVYLSAKENDTIVNLWQKREN